MRAKLQNQIYWTWRRIFTRMAYGPWWHAFETTLWESVYYYVWPIHNRAHQRIYYIYSNRREPHASRRTNKIKFTTQLRQIRFSQFSFKFRNRSRLHSLSLCPASSSSVPRSHTSRSLLSFICAIWSNCVCFSSAHFAFYVGLKYPIHPN